MPPPTNEVDEGFYMRIEVPHVAIIIANRIYMRRSLMTPSKEMHIICMMGLGTHTNYIYPKPPEQRCRANAMHSLAAQL